MHSDATPAAAIAPAPVAPPPPPAPDDASLPPGRSRSRALRADLLAPALLVLAFWACGWATLRAGFVNFGADDWMRVATSYAALRDPAMFLRPDGPPFGPLFFFVYGTVGELLGRDFGLVRAFTALLAGACMFLFHAIVRRYVAPAAAFAAVALAFFTPSSVKLAITPLATYAGLLPFLAGLLLTLREGESRRPGAPSWRALTAAAVLFAAAGFVRYEAMAFAALAGLWLAVVLLLGRRLPWTRVATLVAALAAIAWLPAVYLLVRSWIAFGTPFTFWQKQVEWGEYMQPKEGARLAYWLGFFYRDFLLAQMPALGLLLVACGARLAGAAAREEERAEARRLVAERPGVVLLALLGVAYPLFFVVFFAKAFSAAMVDSYALPAIIFLAPWLAAGLFFLVGTRPAQLLARGGRPGRAAEVVAGAGALLLAAWQVGPAWMSPALNPHHGADLERIGLIMAEERSDRGRLEVAQEWDPVDTRFSNNFFRARSGRYDSYVPIAREEFAHWVRSIASRPDFDLPDVVVVTSSGAEGALRAHLGHALRPALETGNTHYRAYVKWSPFNVARVVAAGGDFPANWPSAWPDASGRVVWVAWDRPAGETPPPPMNLVAWRHASRDWHGVFDHSPSSLPHHATRVAVPGHEGTVRDVAYLPVPQRLPPGDSVIVVAPDQSSTTTPSELQVSLSEHIAWRLDALDFHRPSGNYAKGGWRIWSNFAISTWVRPPAPARAIRVEAIGEPCDGIWPLMSVSWNGEELGRVSVAAPTAATYDIPAQLKSGEAGFLEIAFLNNAENKATGEDRNLIVVGATFLPASE